MDGWVKKKEVPIVAWSDDQYLLRYLVVDYLGLIHVLSSRACWSDLEVERTKKILKASTLKFT